MEHSRLFSCVALYTSCIPGVMLLFLCQTHLKHNKLTIQLVLWNTFLSPHLIKMLNFQYYMICQRSVNIPFTIRWHLILLQHDPEEKTCSPGGDKGNYIMFARATSGDKPNNNKFSHCSQQSMARVMEVKARHKDGCFIGKWRNVTQGGYKTWRLWWALMWFMEKWFMIINMFVGCTEMGCVVEHGDGDRGQQ